MKISPAPLALLALPLLCPRLSLAQAQPAPPAAAAPAAPQQEEKKTELEQRMGRVGKAMRKLRKQVADSSQNESSLQLIATMQDAAKEALQFTPAKAEDLPADQRPKFDKDFRAGINQLLDKLSALKDAVAAGKNDEAAKMVAEILDFEKKEHKEFRRPEKD
jgi:soluble cytochrome b562